MAIAHCRLKLRRVSFTCTLRCCEEKPARAKSPPPSPESAGCSWRMILSRICARSMLPVGRRR